MKAQERHELRENDLSGWLQYGLWTFLREYGSYIFLVLALAFLGFQLWRRHEASVQNAIDAAWADYRALPDIGQPEFESKDFPDRTQRLIDDHPDIKMLRAQAYLRLGNFYDKAKIELKLLQDLKITGSESLDKALAAYNSALAEEPDDMLVAAKARLGIAGVQEDRGEWDKAVEQYKLLSDPAGKYASNPYFRVAQEKLKNIDERRSAPRLAEMIPPPPPPRPASQLPDLTGLPGMGPASPNVGAATRSLGGPLDGILSTPLTSSPATNPSSASPLTAPGLSITQYPAPAPASAPTTTQP